MVFTPIDTDTYYGGVTTRFIPDMIAYVCYDTRYDTHSDKPYTPIDMDMYFVSICIYIYISP